MDGFIPFTSKQGFWYGNYLVHNISDRTIAIIVSLRPTRALSPSYVHELRCTLADVLGRDVDSIVLGSDSEYITLLLDPSQIIAMMLTGQITQH